MGGVPPVATLPPEVIENRRTWATALRSGKYIQGQGYLLKDGKYCCLGVACDLFDRDSLSHLEMESQDISDKTNVCLRLNPPTRGKLANMNDNGSSFKEIADFIEKNIEDENLGVSPL